MTDDEWHTQVKFCKFIARDGTPQIEGVALANQLTRHNQADNLSIGTLSVHQRYI